MNVECYYFANYRLCIDSAIKRWPYSKILEGFTSPMPSHYAYSLNFSFETDIAKLLNQYAHLPALFNTESFSLHKVPDYGWAFLKPGSGKIPGCLLISSPDYGDMTLYMQADSETTLPFSSIIRSCCEAGMGFRMGLALHASFIRKNGEGVLFLGPSGIGKSTQANIWKNYLGADFINGDRPGLRYLDGKWYAFGMPWDGKDKLHRQCGVPIKGIVVLEQAKENSIRRLNVVEANIALFHQAILPLWDDKAVDCITPLLVNLSKSIPFYHLRCLPEKAAAELTYNALFNNGIDV